MLQAMQTADNLSSSSSNSSFAGLLASLTAPKPQTETPASQTSSRRPAWDDGLLDDVATLSYEHALRANARYKPANSAEWNLPQSFDRLAEMCAEETALRAKSDEAKADEAQPASDAMKVGRRSIPTLDETRKRASVTVRLSEAEYEQLHKRAAEAGLTVSSYLRSCTFEAEALRAQVKEALAQLRAEKPSVKAAQANFEAREARTKTKAETAKRSAWREWLSRIFPQLLFGQRVVRA